MIPYIQFCENWNLLLQWEQCALRRLCHQISCNVGSYSVGGAVHKLLHHPGIKQSTIEHRAMLKECPLKWLEAIPTVSWRRATGCRFICFNGKRQDSCYSAIQFRSELPQGFSLWVVERRVVVGVLSSPSSIEFMRSNLKTRPMRNRETGQPYSYRTEHAHSNHKCVMKDLFWLLFICQIKWASF